MKKFIKFVVVAIVTAIIGVYAVNGWDYIQYKFFQNDPELENYNLPPENVLADDDSWSVCGIISSGKALRKVEVLFLDKNNKSEEDCFDSPDLNDVYEFDLSKMDQRILVNELSPGEYTYEVRAISSYNSEEFVLTSSDLTIKSCSERELNIKYYSPRGVIYNSEKVYNVAGKLYFNPDSNCKKHDNHRITKVSVGIYDEDDSCMAVNEKNFISDTITCIDLASDNELGKTLNLDNLETGSMYHFVIKAEYTGSSGMEKIVDQEFIYANSN